MERIHASCVVLGECGVLIRGASGSGKSGLARQLVFEATGAGSFASLVSDDRVAVEVRHGRLIARAVFPIAGQLEIRGVGLVGVGHEPATVIRLVIDCEAKRPSRMPDSAEGSALIAGVRLRRLVHHGDPAFAPVVTRLCGRDDTIMTLR